MSCWVVPTVAAELWGVSLEHVLAMIAEGKVTSKGEYQLLVVDVAPATAQTADTSTTSQKPRNPASTYAAAPATSVAAVLDVDEIEALSQRYSREEDSQVNEEQPTPAFAGHANDEELSWVRVRQIVSKRRKRPA
jgi:hypothetical protein